MTQLFNRDGSEFNGTPEYNDAGRPIRLVPVSCDRCCVINGQRLWVMGTENGQPYSKTGFDCWTCGNTGVRGERKERLYTADDLVRVNKAAATREAKRQAEAVKAAAEHQARVQAFQIEHAEFIAKMDSLQGEFWADFKKSFLSRATAPTERQIAAVEAAVAKQAANAASAHFGDVGDKVTLTITVERVITLNHPVYGTNWITIARTADGNVISYKGTVDIGNKGETTTIKATIKGHDVYNGIAQTQIQRPKVLETA